MDKIRIINLRSLKDTGEIELRPFTVLLGQNSSGKSTFIRTFPLLRQSSEAKTLYDILWLGPYVDFGTFDEALCSDSLGEPITIQFNLTIPDILARRYSNRYYYPTSWDYRSPRNTESNEIKCVFSMGQAKALADDPAEFYSCYKISWLDTNVSLIIDDELEIISLDINDRDFTEVAKKTFVLQRWDGLLPRVYLTSLWSEIAKNELVSIVRSSVDLRVSNEKIFESLVGLGFNGKDRALKTLPRLNLGTKWKRSTSQWNTETQKFQDLYESLFLFNFSATFECVSDYLTGLLGNVKYITPVRATAERFYRQQGLSIDELDPSGGNLALYLHSLSDKDAHNFADWTQNNLGFAVRVESSSSHLSVVLYNEENGTKFKLSDVGFGFSQVLPILVQLWRATSVSDATEKSLVRRSLPRVAFPTVFLIEQPELHLHPRFQALLTDLIIRATSSARKSGVDLRVIMETHSETIINRLGKALEFDSHQISNLDIGIYIFDKSPSETNTTVKKVHFNSTGSLTNWPLDFFEPVAFNWDIGSADAPSSTKKEAEGGPD